MRHVDHEERTDGIRDLAEAREVDDAGISRSAGDDELGPMLVRQALDLVHVDARVVAPDAIVDRPEPLAG